MDNFRKGNKFSRGGHRGGGQGGRGFDGNRGGHGGFNRGGGDRPEMHKTVCSDCGVNCEVPFRPTGDKPVYCSDCFKGKRNDAPQHSHDRGNRGFNDRNKRPDFDNKQRHQNTNAKEGPNYKAQFDMLNTKIDEILDILNLAMSDEVD